MCSEASHYSLTPCKQAVQLSKLTRVLLMELCVSKHRKCKMHWHLWRWKVNFTSQQESHFPRSYTSQQTAILKPLALALSREITLEFKEQNSLEKLGWSHLSRHWQNQWQNVEAKSSSCTRLTKMSVMIVHGRTQWCVTFPKCIKILSIISWWARLPL